ncbi:MAG: DegV family protein [Clostridiales bacterium]|nr:DegV family protein [Clostridiales bacterium]
MFTVVTDSSVYMTRQEAETLGVHVLPLLYSVDGISLSEGYAYENGSYHELIAQGKTLHTAQVSPSSFLKAFGELLHMGHSVLCLTMSSRLSGVYSSATMAARELDISRIAVVDSLSTAGGLAMLVEKACELSQESRTLSEAADELVRMRERVGIALSVDNMDALRKSGRLGFVRQSVGTVLNLRPILLVRNGAVVSGGVVRGANAQLAELVRNIPAEAKRIIVHYIADQAAAQVLCQMLRPNFTCPISIAEVGPVLAIHLGLNAIGVAWIC